MKKRLLIEKDKKGKKIPRLAREFRSIPFPPTPPVHIKPFPTTFPLNIFLIRNFFVIM